MILTGGDAVGVVDVVVAVGADRTGVANNVAGSVLGVLSVASSLCAGSALSAVSVCCAHNGLVPVTVVVLIVLV